MPAPATTTVVITDANVLINFVHIGQVALLGKLAACNATNSYCETRQRVIAVTRNQHNRTSHP